MITVPLLHKCWLHKRGLRGTAQRYIQPKLPAYPGLYTPPHQKPNDSLHRSLFESLGAILL